jgi:hypothetical protein
MIRLVRAKLSFQAGVGRWMQACFGAKISTDLVERSDRFIDETHAVSLVAPTRRQAASILAEREEVAVAGKMAYGDPASVAGFIGTRSKGEQR